MARHGRSFPFKYQRRRPLTRRIGTVQTITMSGIPSEEAFGNHSISAGLQIIGIGIDSGEAFGTAKLNLSIQPSGIGSTEAFGTAKLNQKIVFTGIASGEAFGAASVATVRAIRPTGIPSAEAFGSTTLSQDIGIRYPLRIHLDDMSTRVLVDFR